jgi:hypothetical protein
MAKSRSQFTRLGEHVARDAAREVRERAAANPDDDHAQSDLADLNAAASPEGLQKRVAEIVRLHLQDADETLNQAFPNGTGMTVSQYGNALYEWWRASRGKYVYDSPEGRTAEIVKLCALILEGTGSGVLGYGLSQKNHLLVREFADGPALAREAAMIDARSRGGKEKRKALKITNTDRDRAICNRFCARSNKRQSKKAWAEDNAANEKMSVRNLRRILASC